MGPTAAAELLTAELLEASRRLDAEIVRYYSLKREMAIAAARYGELSDDMWDQWAQAQAAYKAASAAYLAAVIAAEGSPGARVAPPGRPSSRRDRAA
ncbi:hypothetical protein D5H75_40570 [Bailinhaonella thermotolerans]|uniref:Uncharacterized protein n=1 Tax=Bailinhaonella thermotolerans TaxID=1070861 RepID=A0A3A3ZZ67_9ACTN|nr:hypothetical protein D5H75_40570 [Bailinhaonella thermotolerans]